MLGRSHPRLGWLFVTRPDWNRTLQQCLRFRDEAADPNASGHPPAYVEWVQRVEMPQLAIKYRPQFGERVDELTLKLASLESDIQRGRLDLQPAADAMRGEIAQLEWLMLREAEP